MNKTEQIISDLLQVGMTEQPSPSKKYRKFGPTPKGNYFFVSKKAGVRFGTIVTKSISITDKVDRLGVIKYVMKMKLA
jgi:hypothetical protein